MVRLFLGSPFSRVRKEPCWLCSHGPGRSWFGVQIAQVNPQQCHLPAVGPWRVMQPLCATRSSSVKWVVNRPPSGNVSYNPCPADCSGPGQECFASTGNEDATKTSACLSRPSR